MAFGQLEDEVPGVPNEAPAGLEQALLQTRQRPALDGEQQDQSPQEIAEVVGDEPRRAGSSRYQTLLCLDDRV